LGERDVLSKHEEAILRQILWQRTPTREREGESVGEHGAEHCA
jgi:hypothetical protein